MRVLVDSSDSNEMLRAQGRIRGLEEAIHVRDVLLAKPGRRPQ